ncbi:hypothetical protein M9434_004899 [Picochlorum sp. BPE23]|nr:hypothetical protein M9434_004882 [Picochlorum sp. BPE23]KAI8111327.1 hypothetical protein M9434_004899 [Picochlorum sp. BPE23]
MGRYDIPTEGTYLIGSGKECSPSDGVFQRTEGDCMSLDFDENADPCSNHPMRVYAHSELCLKHPDRFETIKSLQCLKEEKKNSKVVLVLFESEERLALVTTFSRMVRGNKTLARFAHCHIFKYLAPDNDPCTGIVHRYRHSGRLSTAPCWTGEHCEEDFEEMDAILPVESIIGKVVQFISPISYSENGGKAYHIVYCARSRSRSGQRRQATMSWLEQ